VPLEALGLGLNALTQGADRATALGNLERWRQP
jgi:hypothetical protein